jgi:gentisate 1,2-dioxygenase
MKNDFLASKPVLKATQHFKILASQADSTHFRHVDALPDLHFPWTPVKARLDSSVETHSVYHYIAPGDRPISDTLSAQAERISAGTTSPTMRETCSFVYHVVHGSGSTEVQNADNTMTMLKWTKGDTLAIPAWSRLSHTASAQGDVYLFAFSDREMLKRLGFYRKQEA